MCGESLNDGGGDCVHRSFSSCGTNAATDSSASSRGRALRLAQRPAASVGGSGMTAGGEWTTLQISVAIGSPGSCERLGNGTHRRLGVPPGWSARAKSGSQIIGIAPSPPKSVTSITHKDVSDCAPVALSTRWRVEWPKGK